MRKYLALALLALALASGVAAYTFHPTPAHADCGSYNC